MRIAVVGIGGVGGYFGGKLARYYASSESVDIIFIARGEHLHQIQEKGLKQVTTEGEFTAYPTLATDDPRDSGSFDMVLFCVKRYDLENSAERIQANINKDSIVISLLNGVDNVKPLTRILSGAEILNGCVYIGAHIVNPGVVRQAGGTCQLFFGPEDGPVKELRPVEMLLKKAGIQAVLTENIQKVVWEKYLFVCPLATATTYLQQPMGAFVEHTEKRSYLEGLMREVAEVAKAKGIHISKNMIHEALAKNSLFPYETRTSLQLDFENNRRTEIDLFTGYIVKSAKELGIPVPLHDEAYNKLTNSNSS